MKFSAIALVSIVVALPHPNVKLRAGASGNTLGGAIVGFAQGSKSGNLKSAFVSSVLGAISGFAKTYKNDDLTGANMA